MEGSSGGSFIGGSRGGDGDGSGEDTGIGDVPREEGAEEMDKDERPAGLGRKLGRAGRKRKRGKGEEVAGLGLAMFFPDFANSPF